MVIDLELDYIKEKKIEFINFTYFHFHYFHNFSIFDSINPLINFFEKIFGVLCCMSRNNHWLVHNTEGTSEAPHLPYKSDGLRHQ